MPQRWRVGVTLGLVSVVALGFAGTELAMSPAAAFWVGGLTAMIALVSLES